MVALYSRAASDAFLLSDIRFRKNSLDPMDKAIL